MPQESESAKELFMRGNLPATSRKLDEALISFDKAVELDVNNAEAWNNWGIVLANLDRCSDAMKSFEKAFFVKSLDRALEVDPEHVYAWHNRGVALMRLGHDVEARGAFIRAGTPGRRCRHC